MFADHLTEVADVLLSAVEDGEVRVNIGDGATGVGVGAEAALWCPEGFYGMPNEPDDDGFCQVIFVRDGNTKRGIGARDGRYHVKAGQPKPGDRWIVSKCDARFLLKREDNAITMYTINEVDDGNAQMLDIRGKTGVTVLLNGGSVVEQKTDSLLLAVNGGGSILIDKDGVQINGKKCSINFPTVTIGLMPGGLPPPPGLNSAIKGTSGMAGLPSLGVTIA